ncbi:hypothetical protein PENSPDRAFT_659622 [Peniophora sp. CONT]|nr:hypothetical protein PENSPDRAFT_659622 [Peniophora sp. CONT]
MSRSTRSLDPENTSDISLLPFPPPSPLCLLALIPRSPPPPPRARENGPEFSNRLSSSPSSYPSSLRLISDARVPPPFDHAQQAHCTE